MQHCQARTARSQRNHICLAILAWINKSKTASLFTNKIAIPSNQPDKSLWLKLYIGGRVVGKFLLELLVLGMAAQQQERENRRLQETLSLAEDRQRMHDERYGKLKA